MTPQKIMPHLWFDKEAMEAAEFYTSIFPRSCVTNVTTLLDTPSGDCDVVSFELAEFKLMAISAGPLFTFNPSISFILNFDPLLQLTGLGRCQWRRHQAEREESAREECANEVRDEGSRMRRAPTGGCSR